MTTAIVALSKLDGEPFRGKRSRSRRFLLMNSVLWGLRLICYGHTRTAGPGQHKTDAECKALLIAEIATSGWPTSTTKRRPIGCRQPVRLPTRASPSIWAGQTPEKAWLPAVSTPATSRAAVRPSAGTTRLAGRSCGGWYAAAPHSITVACSPHSLCIRNTHGSPANPE